MFCPHCGKEISPGFDFCGNCGKPLQQAPIQKAPQAKKKPLARSGCLIIGLVLAVILALLYFSKTDKEDTKSRTLELKSEQLEAIETLKTEGMLDLKPEMNAAYIDPQLWNRMDYSLKDDLGATLAIYCGNTKKSNLYWVEFYDKTTGKKLAKWSQSWGFKIY